MNVRLTETGFEALREAARAYGVAATTLARMLIHRGAIAALEQHARSSSGGAEADDGEVEDAS